MSDENKMRPFTESAKASSIPLPKEVPNHETHSAKTSSIPTPKTPPKK